MFKTTQITLILYSQHRKRSETDPAQHKQQKEVLLTDGQNILTERFQPKQRLEPNFITGAIRNFMAQQKQRKRIILTNDKNIFTYIFQPIQRLQPNFKADGIRNFIYTKYNGDNAKLRIFSFTPQRKRIQSNFVNHTYQTTEHKNTTRAPKAMTSNWVSPLTQSLN